MRSETRNRRRLVREIAIASAIAAILVPSANAEPIDAIVDCYVRHQLGYMAGPPCSAAGALVGAPAFEAPLPEPVATDGFDFRDAGVGAAVGVGGLAALVAAAGVVVTLGKRRRRPNV